MTNSPMPNRLQVLDEAECWRLLGEVPVGRIAMVDHDLPLIFPVNFFLDDRDVIFRTEEGGLLGSAASWGRAVAFQADSIHPEHLGGWSVLVRGELRQVDEASAERLRDMVTPWAGGERTAVGRILASSISGRRIPSVG